VLDNIAVLTKVAAHRTAGVLGDDLALNAEQVSGVRAERELPVVWAVAKGSARNKLILIPLALLLSAFLPGLITPLLMIGGAYLCFEGFEKLSDKFLHPSEVEKAHKEVIDALHDPNLNLAEFEAQKIKGAIRTDFVLSAEIIVISLGTVQQESLTILAGVVISIGITMTVGVYRLVAGIVKLDDLGMHLLERTSVIARKLGSAILVFAPFLMKSLTVVGTAAMFLVGGGIIAHGLPGGEAWLHHLGSTVPVIEPALTLLAAAIAGIVFGAVIAPLVLAAEEITGKSHQISLEDIAKEYI
jgi:predicted DNA repair protein MutK|tara:strand:+ start:648 stop:1547 length:900 start_codon:yes stop_codon:yes gene_type:complete